MPRIFAILLAALVPALAAAEETPDALVKRTTDEVLAIIKADKDVQGGNMAKVTALAEQKVLPHFDFTRMTRLAVGRNWAQATDAQKEALMKEFRTLLVRTYSTSLSQYRNQTIEVKPTRLGAQERLPRALARDPDPFQPPVLARDGESRRGARRAGLPTVRRSRMSITERAHFGGFS